MKTIKFGDYTLNVKLLNRVKKEAREQRKVFENWCELPEKTRKETFPPLTGIYRYDFALHYKGNGLITFDGYLLTIYDTKETFTFK